MIALCSLASSVACVRSFDAAVFSRCVPALRVKKSIAASRSAAVTWRFAWIKYGGVRLYSLVVAPFA